MHLLVLATLLLAEPVGAAPPAQRVGPLAVAVESVGFARRHASCAAPRETASTRCFVVTTQVSAASPDARVPVRRCTLVDVQGRRFPPVTETRVLQPGMKVFAFEVPEHAAIVTFELDGARFEVSHVGAREDMDLPAFEPGNGGFR